MGFKGLSFKEAAEEIIICLNEVPTSMIAKLFDDFVEVTKTRNGDRVYVCLETEDNDVDADEFDTTIEGYGTIEHVRYDEYGDRIYEISVEGYDKTFEACEDDIQVIKEYLYPLPMHGRMWGLGGWLSENWMVHEDGIQILSDCGFRVFYSDEFGYYFGIDGAGYDFIDQHWIPLYKSLGFNWHEPASKDANKKG